MPLSNLCRSRLGTLSLLFILLSLGASAQAERASITATAISSFDHSVSELLVRTVWLGERQVDLALNRVEPLAADATLRFKGVKPAPLVSQRRHFSGTIVGESRNSQVSLSVGADGAIRGVLSDLTGHWILQTDANQLHARLVSELPASARAEHDHFQCGVDSEIRQQSRQARRLVEHEIHRPRVDTGDRYRVRLAFDTTARFVNQFDSSQDVIEYLTDLTNFISTMYISELNTEIVISSITLRDADEPWDIYDELLDQFRSYWNSPENSVDQTRTIAHLIDAGPLSGIAYLNALCFDGYDYGVSRGLGNEFNPDADPPGWGFIVVAHEIGHNFDSDHSHCYDPPIDECYNAEPGCFEGATSLPGPAGEGSGTIMSYCHFQSGSLSNIAPRLGRNHSYGVDPQRVPDGMRAYVLERALIDNPRCPQRLNPAVFSDRFEPYQQLQ